MTREELTQELYYELFEGSHRVFLTGGAGTGKSTLVKSLMKDSVPILTSTTGISAIQINGQTAHSFFKLGISSSVDELKSSDRDIVKKFRMHTVTRYLSKMIKALHKSDFIVIDEVSMLNTAVMDMIVYRLQQAGVPDKPILFTGDLLQLPPVQGDNILHSKEFRKAVVFNLNTIYRTDDLEFIEFSNLIRMGIVDETVKNYLKSKRYNGQDLKGYVQIYPTIREVQSQNEEMLHKIDSPVISYKPEINKKGSKVYDREIDAFMSNSKISSNLELKVGAQIILTRNSICDDYVNGDVAIIEELNSKSIIVRLDRDGDLRRIEYAEFENVEFKTIEGKLEKTTKWLIKALPVMLGWAITIHKSQGQGIEKLYVKTGNLFAQSQFYVAISRSSCPEKLIIDYVSDSGLNNLLDIIPYVNAEAKKFYEEVKHENQYS